MECFNWKRFSRISVSSWVPDQAVSPSSGCDRKPTLGHLAVGLKTTSSSHVVFLDAKQSARIHSYAMK